MPSSIMALQHRHLQNFGESGTVIMISLLIPREEAQNFRELYFHGLWLGEFLIILPELYTGQAEGAMSTFVECFFPTQHSNTEGLLFQMLNHLSVLALHDASMDYSHSLQQKCRKEG